MKKLLACAAFAAIAMGTPALAADAPQVYTTLGYTDADVSDGGGNYSNITGRVGLRGMHFGVEGELSGGLTSKDFSGVSVKLQDEYAGYVVGFLPVGGPDNEVFARVGYAHTDIHGSGFGGSVTEGVNGGAYGAGFQHFWGANGVRFDYTYLTFDKGFGHADTFGVHWAHKF